MFFLFYMKFIPIFWLIMLLFRRGGVVILNSSKVMEKTMFEDFQVQGFWWLPGDKEQVSGTLFYKQEKVELELLGTLGSSKDIMSDLTNYDVILGRSDKGEEFTLFNAYSAGTSVSFPGYATESYQLDSFLVGGHFPQKQDIQFSYCSFIPTYLSTWLNRSVFQQETAYNQENSSIKERKVSYTPLIGFKHYIPSINAYIEEGNSIKFKELLSESVNWTSKSNLSITPDYPESIDWLKEQILSLKELLILFIGKTVYFESISFFGEEEERDGFSEMYRPRYSYFKVQSKPKFKQDFKKSDVLVEFSQIEEKFKTILNSWFEKRTTLDIVFSLYFNDYYLEKSYVHTSFLNSIQILEIYHRHVYEGKPFDEEDYSKYRSQLIDYATDTFPTEFAKRIEGMLKHGNEYTLNKRLKQIINNLDQNSKVSLIGNSANRERFIQQLVDTRNYLTHYDKAEKNNLLETSAERFYAIQRLKAIATLTIAKELGVEESLMLKVLESNSRYQIVLSKAKEFLNKKPRVTQ